MPSSRSLAQRTHEPREKAPTALGVSRGFASVQGPKIVEILDSYGIDLAQGAIVTVEPARVRIRPPEPGVD